MLYFKYPTIVRNCKNGQDVCLYGIGEGPLEDGGWRVLLHVYR